MSIFWESIQKLKASKRTRLIQKTAILRHLLVEIAQLYVCPSSDFGNVWRHFYFCQVCVCVCVYIYIYIYIYIYNFRGTAVAQRLKCCATNRKVAGSIPDGVTEIFHLHNPADRTMAPGVDSASNRNEYQENFLVVNAAGA